MPVVGVLVVQEVHALEGCKGQGEERAARGPHDAVDESKGGRCGDAAVARVVHGREREVGEEGAKGGGEGQR
jgi:hypothetical protein